MKTDTLDIKHMDCMELMKESPDNHFDLAVVDPPYGIGESGGDKKRNRKYNRVVIHKEKQWDDSPPDKHYYNELCRVSKNQIMFGANYYIDILKPSMGWIYWDKNIGGDFSDGELAYTSFKRALRAIQISFTAGTRGGHDRIHPTQKPVKLYDWIFANYAEKGMKILDTHLGSGSSAIASHYAGMHMTACELDEDYYKSACERIHRETSQTTFNL